MWIAVRERFEHFVADLQITAAQRDDGIGKHINTR